MYLLKFEPKKKLLSDVILLCNLNPTHYIYIYIYIYINQTHYTRFASAIKLLFIFYFGFNEIMFKSEIEILSKFLGSFSKEELIKV